MLKLHGDSSRTARLTVVDWRVAHAQALGDGCYALTLLRDSRALDDGEEADATAVIGWRMVGPRDDQMVIERCTDASAERWLATVDGEHAAYQAAILRRAS